MRVVRGASKVKINAKVNGKKVTIKVMMTE